MKQVIVFGNGSIAQLVYHELMCNSPHQVAAFTVDREACSSDSLFGLPLVPFDEVLTRYPPQDFAMQVAVGYVRMNRLRAERCAQAVELGYQLISHISPAAITWADLTVGENTFVSPGCVINPSAVIGSNVFLGACSIVAHDCTVGDHCFFSDRVTLAGGVSIGPYCYLGTSATVRNHVNVARESVIGAGAVILADTDERAVHMGQHAECLPITSDKLNLA